MYHYHWGQFQSHVFSLWALLSLSWHYMVGKTPSWADKSVKNHSDFNIWYWYFSNHQMWQLGWFSKTRSHIMFFKTVIYTTKELKNNPVWSLKQYCMRCYVFLSKIFQLQYFDWNRVWVYIPLQEAALQRHPLRHVCVHYCTITLLTVIRQGIIIEAPIF